jgi:hypothetical protein
MWASDSGFPSAIHANLSFKGSRKIPTGPQVSAFDVRRAACSWLVDPELILPYILTDSVRDLVRRPQFIAPFLIACGTKSAKFANSAVICLQRLSVSQGLPKERLREVLEAFSECTALGTRMNDGSIILKITLE